MRIAVTFCALIATVTLWSCKETKETPLGYKFTVVKKGDGKIVKPGEIMLVDMAIVDENDSAWYDNRQSDYPEMIRIADASKMETERGITEAFRMLSKGDSIAFPMRAKDVFLFMWRMDTPPQVDPESTFTYQILCRDIMDEPTAKKFAYVRDSIHNEKEKLRLAEEQKKQEEADVELMQYNRVQLGKDTVIIDNFLKEKNMKAERLPSGIRYIVKSPGEGSHPSIGDVVSMKYTGQFLDGKEFDSGEYMFTLGAQEVIKGWELAAMSMRKGTVMTVFMPSTLAYGRAGRGPIMPDAILMFEMELLGFRKR